jgi:hypothetical protein
MKIEIIFEFQTKLMQFAAYCSLSSLACEYISIEASMVADYVTHTCKFKRVATEYCVSVDYVASSRRDLEFQFWGKVA